jgi:gluconate 2-dehydrogenase subunit 3-like protein
LTPVVPIVQMVTGMPPGVGRRDVVRGLGVGALMAVVAPAALRAALRPRAPASTGSGAFLTATELDTLRAITARLLPGPPDDPDPGAIEAGCAEAIDALLAAFSFDPPLIHAGGPFSDRAGGRHDDMARFVPLDPLAELGWRIRIEGSQGRPERSFAGEVVGLQQRYREGLASLQGIAGASPDLQDAMLRAPAAADFVSLVLGDTLDVMYGAPEYGGNRGLVGWTATGWPGDVQPRGYTRQEVEEIDPPTPPSGILDVATARDALSRYIPGTTVIDPPEET